MSSLLRIARTTVLSSALLIIPAQRASAYLETNGSFAAGLSGWTTSGTWTQSTTDGLFDTNSAEATGTGTQSISQCVDVSSVGANDTLVLMANAKTPGHSAPLSAAVEIFTSTDCTSGYLATTVDQRSTIGSADSWQILYTPILLPAGVLSARVTLRAEHDEARGGQTTRFDLIGVRESLVTGATFSFMAYVNSFFHAAGTWTWAEDDGWSRPGLDLTPLGAIQGEVAANGEVSLVQCLTLADAVESDLLLSLIRLNAGANQTGTFDSQYDYRLTFWFHDQAGCAGTFTDVVSPWIEPSGTGWWLFYNPVSVPAGAVSVRLELELEPSVLNTEGATFLVDDLVVMPLGNLIFADGFEGGSTSAWN